MSVVNNRLRQSYADVEADKAAKKKARVAESKATIAATLAVAKSNNAPPDEVLGLLVLAGQASRRSFSSRSDGLRASAAALDAKAAEKDGEAAKLRAEAKKLRDRAAIEDARAVDAPKTPEEKARIAFESWKARNNGNKSGK